MRPVLEGLRIADAPRTWRDLGFAVERGLAAVGGVAVLLDGAAAGRGIVGWSVRGIAAGPLDGLPAVEPPAAGEPGRTAPSEHPNGALAVDHLVAVTDDFERTVGALQSGGLHARRIRRAPGAGRQAFYVLSTALLELAGPVDGPAGARLWGLTVAVADLDALATRLGARLGPVRDAVQPGRRIATLRPEAGTSVALAFMSRRDGPGGA